MTKQKLSKFISIFFTLIFFFSLTPNYITYAETQNKNLSTEVSNENEKIVVDFAFSIGNNCASAKYLRVNNLRFQSSPLDWMFNYSLKTVSHLFKTEFKDFFKNIAVDKKKTCGIHRIVYDKKNNITSLHHYLKNVPFDKERKRVDNMMKKRIVNTINTIKKSKSIALISHRTDSEKNFIEFIKEFDKLYPNKKIYIINVKDGKSDEIKQKIIYENKNLKIIEYEYNRKKYPAWDGNPETWNQIMKTIQLSEKHPLLLSKAHFD